MRVRLQRNTYYNEKDADAPKILSDNSFPVVGVGASAGGLEAFRKLIKAIPAESGMAYVLVQHLDPKHDSALASLLQRVTSIPVSEITDEIRVEPNHIYIIPSNKMLVANDGILQLSPRPDSRRGQRNLPIDLFFTSLAEVHQAHAIGIVLSGTATDGTAGLKAIKDHGGITFAEAAASAEYDGMPHSAILAGVVDFILAPEAMPEKLRAIQEQIDRSDAELQQAPREEEDVYKQILFLVRLRKGTDFTYYKQSTIRRRILRRMAINKADNVAAYYRQLQESKTEQDALYQDMLIPVTAFFRDHKVFDALCKTVFPHILEQKAAGAPIRIWVAACSTGEEAYSMAICLKEYLGELEANVQLFASDISEPAIAKARKGSYTKSEVAGVSTERLSRYFTEAGGRYRLKKDIRDMCVFATDNFLKDPPFGKMDLVSCRNVLIYLEPYLQKKALTTFHYALHPNGFLLLGKSETAGTVPDLFAGAVKTDKLYTRRDVQGRSTYVASASRREQEVRDIAITAKIGSMATDFQKTADEMLLSHFTPAGVVVNEQMEIVHFRGRFDVYLSQTAGKPSHNLLKMAKTGLAFELRNLIHKAKKDGQPISKDGILVMEADTQRTIRIEAIPLPNVAEPHYLVLFHESQLIEREGTGVPGGSRKDEATQRLQRLETELSQAREDMRTITEEQEAANEELQSANEELLSSSEEMQSLNEELETSKEELQSTNEELTVLNQELNSLNDQLTSARNYAEAVVATIHHPMVVLDKHLRVKSANEAFYRTFHVDKRETEGILVYDLGNRQWNIPQLRTLLEEVLPEKSAFTDLEVTHNFSGIGERVMLLSGLEIKVDEVEEHMILLTIQDFTERKRAVEQLKASEAKFRQIADSLPAKITNADAEGNVYYFNKAWVNYTGLSFAELQHGGWMKAFHPGSVAHIRTMLAAAIVTGKDFEMEVLLADSSGAYKWHLSRVVAIKDENGKVVKWVGAATEIHSQKEQKEALEHAVSLRTAELLEATGSLLHKNKELKRINAELESFTYVSSHDLQEPLRKIQTLVDYVRSQEFKNLSEGGKQSFLRIEAAAGRMQTLIRDLLAYAHANKEGAVLQKTDLNEIVTEVMEDLSDVIQEKGASIETYDLCEALINPFQFRQVIHNLFTNSLKFCNTGTPPAISIRCKVNNGKALSEQNTALAAGKLLPDSSYCHIAFTDNDIGFDDSYSEKMFEVFQRLNTREQYAGTGIGLAIVKKIVDQHEGAITACSAPGKGATFNIYIKA